METVTMDVVAVDGDKITLKNRECVYDTDRASGDHDVFVGDKVIVSFNKGRLWFWVYWLGNSEIEDGNSVNLPNEFVGKLKGYTGNQCLVCVNGTHYLIPAYCRVPSGQYKFKVTCRYAGSMKISRWEIVGNPYAI